jgi:hypothetical protein
LQDAGFQPLQVTYLNTLLFPMVAGTLVLKRLIGGASTDDLAPPLQWLNSILREIFAAERHVVGRIPLPVGVPLLAVAKV